ESLPSLHHSSLPSRNTRVHHRSPELYNLATGLLRCPHCHGSMRLDRKHNHGKVYSYLVCASSHMGKTDCATRPDYNAFESALLAIMAGSATMRKALGQPSGEPTELVALRGKVQSLDEKLNGMVANYEETPSKLIASRIAVLEQEVEALRSDLLNKEAAAKA